MTARFLAAAAHAAPILLDKAATLDKTCALIQEAGRGDVRLLGFPETFVPGYAYWLGLYPPLAQREVTLEYAAQSVDVAAGELDAVQAACAQHRVNVVLGLSERDGGTLYNSQAFIDEQGSLLAVRRKLQPTMSERSLWGQGDGSTLRVYDMPVGRVGGLICGEHSMNLARHALILQHEEIHVSSWPTFATMKGSEDWFDSHVDALSKVHAYTGSCFVIVAQDPVTQANLDRIERELGPQDIITAGGARSAIYGPGENFVAPPHIGLEEKLVIGEIDLGRIQAAKLQHDSAGHYARSEILRLVVDTEPKRPLVTANESGRSRN
ncbi:MAG TPA: carbon-nitrogen hydrolase family protein [Steroidobacteraceae bacterium]|nr:carbon-nitrogen hydrolase family protein [Steroidobacteraceae bacterium]